MDAENEAHLARVVERFATDVQAKYRRGQAEHGGQLWLKPGVLDHAIEEALDLVVYLYTLKEQAEKAVAQ